MNREYLSWYSQRLHRDMEMLVFGHAGAKVLVFPTREGRFFEYEQLGLVASLAEKLQAGHLQLYCIEGLAADSLYGFHRHPADRIRRHAALEDYILNEVLPLMRRRTRIAAPSCMDAASALSRRRASSSAIRISSASSSPFPGATT